MPDSTYRRARSSMDVDRPYIDPTILGIPQGWDDDYMVPVAGESPARFTRRPHANLNPLRDRVKLVNFTNRRRNEAPTSPVRPSASDRGPSIPRVQRDQGKGDGITQHIVAPRVEGRRTIGQKCNWGESVYRVGYEREIMDTEARLQETMLDLVGSHTFATFETAPSRVLDIGTGLGLWPIAQSKVWPNAEFIGLDRVPCQLDTNRLPGRWSLGNISWVQADFLEPLPFPDNSFDHVHLRFIALGVPEPKWHSLLEECCRVLRRGGKLEMVETSYSMPSAPTSFQTSFSSLLIAESIAEAPVHAIDFILPMLDNVVPSTLQSVHRQTFQSPPAALQDATSTWITSALDYKTSFRYRGGTLEQTKRLLRWAGDIGSETDQTHPVSLWAWVVEKA